MKLKTLLSLFLICMTTLGYAQDIKQTINQEFMAYQDAIINKEFEKSLDYIIPGLFEIYPRQQMLQLMENTFNDPTIKYEIKNTAINQIEDIKEIEGKFYALLTYSNQMNIKYLGDEKDTEEQKKAKAGFIKVSLENTFGSNNVAYNPATEFFEVKAEKNVYAISENGKTDWKFLMIEKEQKVIMDQLLPAELASKI